MKPFEFCPCGDAEFRIKIAERLIKEKRRRIAHIDLRVDLRIRAEPGQLHDRLNVFEALPQLIGRLIRKRSIRPLSRIRRRNLQRE